MFQSAQPVLGLIGYIAQWLERLTADQQVPGSNPGVPSYYLFSADVRAMRISQTPRWNLWLSKTVATTCFHSPL